MYSVLAVLSFLSSLVRGEGGVGMSMGLMLLHLAGSLFWKRSVVSTRCENPRVWLNTANPATALPTASWNGTTSVQVGLLFVVVMPGLTASILSLSVSLETRHELLVVLLIVEIESKSLSAIPLLTLFGLTLA